MTWHAMLDNWHSDAWQVHGDQDAYNGGQGGEGVHGECDCKPELKSVLKWSKAGSTTLVPSWSPRRRVKDTPGRLESMLAESQEYLEWVHKIRITFSPPQNEPQITVEIIRLRWLAAAAVDRKNSLRCNTCWHKDCNTPWAEEVSWCIWGYGYACAMLCI